MPEAWNKRINGRLLLGNRARNNCYCLKGVCSDTVGALGGVIG